jgi:hypothetical protein
LAMTNITWKFYMLFVALNFADFIIIALFFPETKGQYKHLDTLSVNH